MSCTGRRARTVRADQSSGVPGSAARDDPLPRGWIAMMTATEKVPMQKHKHTRTLTALFISVPPACLVSPSSAQTPQALTGAAAFGGWKSDAPGVRRHIRPSDLPPPATGKDPEGSIAKIVRWSKRRRVRSRNCPTASQCRCSPADSKCRAPCALRRMAMSFCPRAAPVGHGITSATERIPH